MNNRRHIIIFFITYFLLTSCISSEPTRSRRQKRGVLKMMMHIMWDPVRLIRYWYAYDVSKEIAKSWRKILPTILLLPVTQHMPHSHGFAKYVHPTFGVKDSEKKKIKHSRFPMPPTYQRTASNVKSNTIHPSTLHESLPSTYSLPRVPLQYYSSKEFKSNIHKKNNVPEIFVSHVPYEDEKGNNQYSVAHYFVDDSNSREEVISHADFLDENHNVDEDFQPLSSQKVLSNAHNERFKQVPPILPQNFLHYTSQAGSESNAIQNGKIQEILSALHPGQEFHVVLHPIPVNDFTPNYFKRPSNGQASHLIRAQLQSNASHETNFAPFPLMLKAFSENNSESENVIKDQASLSEDLNKVQFSLNPAESNISHENVSSSFGDTKSSVTWIPQKNGSETRKSNYKGTEIQSDESKLRTVSMHRNYMENLKLSESATNSFSISRNNINMERLREDLKHGTPVLIPFNRNTNTTETVTGNSNKSIVSFSQNDKQNKNNDLKIKQKDPPVASKVSGATGTDINSSSEHPGERNSTQRLLLFLKKRQSPQKVS